MIRRLLSREGRSRTVRITGTPITVKVVEAPEMPPRPQGRRPVAGDVWWASGGVAVVVAPDARFDPCGAPAIASGKHGRKVRPLCQPTGSHAWRT
jgi:hypothetical protein